jgi:hypothetical protein
MHDCFLYNIRIASVYLTPFNKLQGAKTSFRVKQIIDASQTACLHPEQFFWHMIWQPFYQGFYTSVIISGDIGSLVVAQSTGIGHACCVCGGALDRSRGCRNFGGSSVGVILGILNQKWRKGLGQKLGVGFESLKDYNTSLELEFQLETATAKQKEDIKTIHKLPGCKISVAPSTDMTWLKVADLPRNRRIPTKNTANICRVWRCQQFASHQCCLQIDGEMEKVAPFAMMWVWINTY